MNEEDKDVANKRRVLLRRWLDENFSGSQADFLADAARRGHKINQGEFSGLLARKSFGEKKARNIEIQAGMPRGYLLTTALEVQATNDVRALQFLARSLMIVLTANAPGAAVGFAAVLRQQAKKANFDPESGLLGQVLGTADEGPRIAANAVARALLQDSERQPRPRIPDRVRRKS
jgi:hypothetical protein